MSSPPSTAVRARARKPRNRVASASSPLESKPSRQPAHPRPASDRRPVPRLADLGVHGFEQYEVAIYAALVTEDPLLLVGRSGSSAMMTSSVALTRCWPRSP
jgi:hypothetical protein